MCLILEDINESIANDFAFPFGILDISNSRGANDREALSRYLVDMGVFIQYCHTVAYYEGAGPIDVHQF